MMHDGAATDPKSAPPRRLKTVALVLAGFDHGGRPPTGLPVQSIRRCHAARLSTEYIGRTAKRTADGPYNPPNLASHRTS